MQGFPLVKAARVVGWCPWFIPLESWHWWRWWTAGTFTTSGGGLCPRPDPRVPKPTTTPQHRVYRCLVIVEHALLPVRAGMSDEFSVGTDSSDESARLRLGAERTTPKLVGRAWNPSEPEIVGPYSTTKYSAAQRDRQYAAFYR